MRLLAWLSVIAGVAAFVLVFALVIGTPEWRSQLLGLSLPLDFSEPEATLVFLPSIALASFAVVAGAPAYRHRPAHVGLALGLVSSLCILGAMGFRGLQTLF